MSRGRTRRLIANDKYRSRPHLKIKAEIELALHGFAAPMAIDVARGFLTGDVDESRSERKCSISIENEEHRGMRKNNEAHASAARLW